MNSSSDNSEIFEVQGDLFDAPNGAALIRAWTLAPPPWTNFQSRRNSQQRVQTHATRKALGGKGSREL